MNKKTKLDDANYIAPQLLEAQENLDDTVLTSIIPNRVVHDTNSIRPTQNFIDVMKWVEKNFSTVLSDHLNVNRFIHNRIVIDGQFLQFAKEKGISIECLYKDSVISWKTDNNFEKFFVQGVFLIKTKDVEFIHAALFHKGNQFEDEISFFVICSNSNFENYVKLRNSFDEWVTKRDRSNLHIRVIDGEDIPYTKDNSWSDLFLPEDIKSDLKSLVEGFLASKDFYLKNKIPWKRGVLLYGHPGNGKTSIIRSIMSNFNFKPVTPVAGANDDAIREAFAYAEEQSPSLLYFEDLDSMIRNGVNVSSFLNLMDGISAKNGLLVIATANNFKELPFSITDRPSRFDRKFEIPLPNQEMAYIYLSRWFGKIITVKKCKELAKLSEKYGFSYAYLKEIYISSMFEALAHKRQIPTEKDVDNALNRLMKDKSILNNASKISTDKYFK